MADAQSKHSGFYRFANIWTFLVTLIPSIFGAIMLWNHAAVTTPGATATDVFRAMAYRNFASSIVLGAALFSQPKRVVAFLLALRGLTEIADGLSGVFAATGGAMVAPFVGAVGDLLIAFYFLRLVERAPSEL